MSRAPQLSDDRSARERIADAAAELFARDGFDRTPASRIAAEAQVPQGLIFYHFGTKIGLLLALVQRHTETMLADIEAAVASALEGRTEHDVAAIVVAVRDVLGAGPDSQGRVRRIVFQEMAAHPQIREQAQLLHTRAIDAVATGLRAYASAGGAVDDHVVTALARTLVGTALLGALLYEHGDPELEPAHLATIVSRTLA
jgi:AcrR family transcriptional regulator